MNCKKLEYVVLQIVICIHDSNVVLKEYNEKFTLWENEFETKNYNALQDKIWPELTIFYREDFKTIMKIARFLIVNFEDEFVKLMKNLLDDFAEKYEKTFVRASNTWYNYVIRADTEHLIRIFKKKTEPSLPPAL